MRCLDEKPNTAGWGTERKHRCVHLNLRGVSPRKTRNAPPLPKPEKEGGRGSGHEFLSQAQAGTEGWI